MVITRKFANCFHGMVSCPTSKSSICKKVFKFLQAVNAFAPVKINAYNSLNINNVLFSIWHKMNEVKKKVDYIRICNTLFYSLCILCLLTILC